MTKWEKGQSGNPKGRPKGSRDAITKAFLDDVTKDWREHGMETIHRAREERPAEYVRMVANLLPREARMELDVNSEASQAFLEALKALTKDDYSLKIIDGEAEEIENVPTLPKEPESD